MHSYLATAASTLSLLALSQGPALAVELDNAGIGATQDGRGGVWFFDVELEGTPDISTAMLTVPDATSTPLPLACDDFAGTVECSLPEEDAGPFVSFGALLQTFPVGVYFLSINNGERTASLPFDPMEPDGFLTITFPANGATHVSSTPVVVYDNTCGNCTDLGFALRGGPAMLDLLFETTDLSSPGSILYADWQSPSKPPMLPSGPYVVFGAAVVADVSTRSFDQGMGPEFQFDYSTGAGQGTAIVFRVPEPGSAASAASALAALLALASTRRARRRH